MHGLLAKSLYLSEGIIWITSNNVISLHNQIKPGKKEHHDIVYPKFACIQYFIKDLSSTISISKINLSPTTALALKQLDALNHVLKCSNICIQEYAKEHHVIKMNENDFELNMWINQKYFMNELFIDMSGICVG